MLYFVCTNNGNEFVFIVIENLGAHLVAIPVAHNEEATSKELAG